MVETCQELRSKQEDSSTSPDKLTGAVYCLFFHGLSNTASSATLGLLAMAVYIGETLLWIVRCSHHKSTLTKSIPETEWYKTGNPYRAYDLANHSEPGKALDSLMAIS